MKKSALSTLMAFTITSGALVGCARGSVSGEIDGRTVPSFFSPGAFGGVEDIAETDVFALNGVSLASSDSCVDGGRLFELNNEARDAAGRGDIDDFEEAQADLVEFTNATIPVESWIAVLLFVGRDIDDVREERFDLEDQERDEVSIGFSLCLQAREAELDRVDGVDVFNGGADCFSAGEGALSFALNPDDTELRVTGENVEMQFDDGDKAGDVDIDFTFLGCSQVGEAVEESFKIAAEQG